MKVTGKLVKVLERQEGTTQKGNKWVKQDFVIDTQAKYNSEICFTLFGEEKVKMLPLSLTIGQEFEVHFNLSSREYNGKYYTQAQAWKIVTDNKADEYDDEDDDDFEKSLAELEYNGDSPY